MRAAIVQSSYIPWKGYFSLIHLVDRFVFYDDVQYTRQDWRNRNRIRTPDGLHWLTIPIEVKGRRFQRVCDARVSEPGWAERHWRTIEFNYRHAACHAEIAPQLQALYESCAGETRLSAINGRFIAAICTLLRIPTALSWSMDYRLGEGRTERLVDLCRQLGASEYLSGPAARTYLHPSLFEQAGIRVCWMDYRGYTDYAQLHGPPCIHEASIVDLLFNLGGEGAAAHLAAFRRRAEGTVFAPNAPQPSLSTLPPAGLAPPGTGDGGPEPTRPAIRPGGAL